MGPYGQADTVWGQVGLGNPPNAFFLNGTTTAPAIDDTSSQVFKLTVTLGVSASTVSFTPQPATVVIY